MEYDPDPDGPVLMAKLKEIHDALLEELRNRERPM